MDNNKDGDWDELLVEVSLNAKSKEKLIIEWVAKENYPSFEKLTNVRFSLKS